MFPDCSWWKQRFFHHGTHMLSGEMPMFVLKSLCFAGSSNLNPFVCCLQRVESVKLPFGLIKPCEIHALSHLSHSYPRWIPRLLRLAPRDVELRRLAQRAVGGARPRAALQLLRQLRCGRCTETWDVDGSNRSIGQRELWNCIL